MNLGELLRKRKDAITQRWLDDVLATYSDHAAKTFKREKDPFANPVGHGLRVATQAIFDLLMDGAETEKTREPLHDIIKMRAVQDFTASEALEFIFQLKATIRAELGNVVQDPKIADQFVVLEGQIDQIALAAFDVYARCREQVYELRTNEMKRSVSWVVNKMRQRGVDSGSDSAPAES